MKTYFLVGKSAAELEAKVEHLPEHPEDGVCQLVRMGPPGLRVAAAAGTCTGGKACVIHNATLPDGAHLVYVTCS